MAVEIPTVLGQRVACLMIREIEPMRYTYKYLHPAPFPSNNRLIPPPHD